MKFRVNLQKENFKFSCTHFTIFGPNHGERLHGHNYQLTVQIHLLKLDEKLGMAFDFNLVKPVIRDLCDYFDEYILIPTGSPYLQIQELADTGQGEQTEVIFHSKTYRFPKDDVRQIQAVNITSEELARHFATELKYRIKDLVIFEKLEVTVEETRGQSVTCTL